MGFGGKGANQAVAARLCGAHVSMVARLGDDLFGPPTIKNFESLGIDTSHVRLLEGVSSGVAPIFVDPSGQNRILVVKGANDRLMPADVDLAAPLLKQADCIILQFEIPMETVYHTIRFARENGIKCILNPAPGGPVDLDEVARTDYFIPNESEAETIGGKPVKTVDDARMCAQYFLDRGIPRVIITLGENGALLAGDGTMELVPAYTVADQRYERRGDAFIGSFATFLARGRPEQDAIAQACLYASLSTTKRRHPEIVSFTRAAFETHKQTSATPQSYRPDSRRRVTAMRSCGRAPILTSSPSSFRPWRRGVRPGESHPGRRFRRLFADLDHAAPFGPRSTSSASPPWSGNTWVENVTANVTSLMQRLGEGMTSPIIPGAGEPLMGNRQPWYTNEERLFGNAEYLGAFSRPTPEPMQPGKENAVDFIVRKVKEFPNEVTLLVDRARPPISRSPSRPTRKSCRW